jgi:hypothetical protein
VQQRQRPWARGAESCKSRNLCHMFSGQTAATGSSIRQERSMEDSRWGGHAGRQRRRVSVGAGEGGTGVQDRRVDQGRASCVWNACFSVVSTCPSLFSSLFSCLFDMVLQSHKMDLLCLSALRQELPVFSSKNFHQGLCMSI